MKYLTHTATALMIAGLLTPVAASAITVTTPSPDASATATSAKDQKLDAKLAKAKDRGDQELDRRISALTDLNNAVNAMIKISTDAKASLTANIQSSITDLTNLKGQIDAETDMAALKSDISSVAKSYRVFILVIPQGRITAAADKIEYAASLMADISTKLQARVSAAQAGGQTIDALSKSLTDLNAKIADATTQASAATSAVSPLVPDNGDTTKAAANTKALSGAHADIKAGIQDLKAARKDIGTIVAGLKKLEPSFGTASSTTDASSSAQ